MHQFAKIVLNTTEENAKVEIDGHDLDPKTVSAAWSMRLDSTMPAHAEVTLTFYTNDLVLITKEKITTLKDGTVTKRDVVPD